MNEEGNMKDLLRDSLMQKPTSEGFKDSIMNQIKSNEQVEEMALKSLLMKHGMEKPSINFTAQLMDKIQSQSVVSASPIISKKGWFFIAVVIITIVLVVMNTGSSGIVPQALTDTYSAGLTKLLSFDMPGILKSPVFALSLFALVFFLFVDYLLKTARVTVKS